MPFLDNLILGRPGGDRRRRFGEIPPPGRDAAAERGSDGKPAGVLSTLPRLHRGADRLSPGWLGDGPAQAMEEGERRQCGNSACGRSWALRWKSRQYPIFDGQWACSRACLSAMVKIALTRETGDGVYDDGPVQHHHRVPLGLVMLAQGWITHPELQRALEAQRTHGSGRIGKWLVSECGLKPERIARGLGAQWNCPVLSTEGSWPEAMALALPRMLLEEYGVVPLRVAGKKILYVGFQDSLDAAASFALERMTGLRAESGVLQEEDFSRARETLLRCDFPGQSLAAVGDRDGLARAIAETVEHEQPEASRLVRLHRYYWLRIWAKGDLDRAAGDLPSNANGVRDYLFTIGSRVSSAHLNQKGSRPTAAPERPSAAEDTVKVVENGHPSEGRSTATQQESGSASMSAGLNAPVESVPDIEAELFAEPDAAVESEDKVEAVHTEVEPELDLAEAGSKQEEELYSVAAERAAILDGPWTQHSLARQEAWFDNDSAGDGMAGNDTYREQTTGLQRFMRKGFDSDVETIDGEYLPIEVTITGSSAPTEVQPSHWSPFGLLKRLTPSFHDQEGGPGSGPGREG